MADSKITCPCGLRDHISMEECSELDCNECCQIAKEDDDG